ncbi:MAG: UDPGP type 1 family protein [Phycisphaeraceae bacterium]|nr:MAG: UDPGP type 1 family protein [Phycisphaeraceae bacterium]
MTTLESTRSRLAAAGQDHLLAFHDRLAPPQQDALLAQINALDLEAVPALVRAYVTAKPTPAIPRDVQPAAYYPFNPDAPARPYNAAQYRAAGDALLRAGKVGAFVVAGGQGSRLGYEGPKGCYPAGAVSRKPLFQIFAEQLLAARTKFGRVVPWYIMTSPLNHDATTDFFRAHDFFGLGRENLMFFPQGVMPSFDLASGRILLAEPGVVATNPDGHGGAVRALHSSGALDDMQRRGVEHLSYIQVDNPLVRITDPVFLGLHAAAPDSSAEMSSKMIPKAYPGEKLGVFCRVDGKTEVIEYSDLPAALAEERLPDGTLRFVCGSIAIHVLAVEFIRRLATDPRFALPYHRAEKKVPCIDPATGARVEPAAPNGVKLERFIFDALAMCRSSVVYETDRVEEFAPIKNASGLDSPESSARIQTARAARWLGSRGVRVPRNPAGDPDCTLEISPLTALEPADLGPDALPRVIERGASLAV